ncbi:hypothetical protein TGMAS_213415 [Toxoplasma gondii MAS]|uniref:Uncharacterized protein n=1 Tax=Toxoplasma gondii MAS TaxID=943118 RepID=A0A086QD77_TOXGO|nr:hypothetical protein TGMAS_213415 [Toxoplasma gondii MAS]
MAQGTLVNRIFEGARRLNSSAPCCLVEGSDQATAHTEDGVFGEGERKSGWKEVREVPRLSRGFIGAVAAAPWVFRRVSEEENKMLCSRKASFSERPRSGFLVTAFNAVYSKAGRESSSAR